MWRLRPNVILVCLNGSLKCKLAAVADFGTGAVAGFTLWLSCLQLKRNLSWREFREGHVGGHVLLGD